MNSYRKTAIIVGVLFIIATVAPLLSFPFSGFITDDPDYLVNVSANTNQVIIGALFEFIMCVAIAGIAIWAYPILKKYNEGLALGYVGFRLIEGILLMVAVIGLLSLLTLSQEFVKAGAPGASYFQSLGTLLLAVRDWGGQLGSIVFGLGALIFYYLLYQSKLIPRWLSIWGLIGAPLALAEGLLSMFGLFESFSTNAILLSLPIAVNEMVLAVWLIVKGFNVSAIASLSAKASR